MRAELHNQNRKRWAPPWILLTIAVTGTLGAWSLAHDRKRDQQAALTTAVRSGLDVVAAQLTTSLAAQAKAQVRMASRWAQRRTTKSEWQADAKTYVTDFAGYQALEWVDTEGVVRWVEPLAGNEIALNVNLAAHPDRKRVLLESRSGSLSITDPISLVQGGKGFLLPVPIHGARGFEGYILGVFRIDEWIRSTVGELDIQFAVSKESEPLYSSAKIADTSHAATRPLRILGQSWTIEGYPKPTLVGDVFTAEPLTVFGLGSLLSLLFGLVAQLGLSARRNSVRLHESANALQEARNRLEEEQKRTERAVAGTSDGLWDFDPATEEVWYSPQFRRLLGLREDQMSSFPSTWSAFLERLHPEDKHRALAAVEAHLKDNALYEVEYRLRLENGNYRWFLARGQSVRTAHGQVLRMSGSITDIHEHQQARSRLILATRAAGIGLWDWDVPSGENYFSDTFFTMLGFSPGGLPMERSTWRDLIHPEDQRGAEAALQRHIDCETTTYNHEHRVRCEDGRWLWVRDVGEVVEREPDGTPKRMIGVQVEIQTLRTAKEQAESANRSKSEFLANMSHEIRTPMTAILGYADLLGGELGNDPDQARGAVETIQANAGHLLAIINDILDVSKIEAGQMAIENIATRPAKILADVVKLTAPRAAGRGIYLETRFATAIPETIQSDPTRVKQILLNLVGNAIKFTEVGGVTISVGHDDDAQRLYFDVIDTGIGMTEEQRARITRFEAFQQADASTTRTFGGSGLGLRISNALAQMLDGSIEVRSSSGQGSTFRASIATGDTTGVERIHPEQEGFEARLRSNDDPSLTASEQPDLTDITVLLAEDGPDNQRLLSFYLTKAGAEVSICENGALAVAMLESMDANDALPDVVLMDMQMPELDGYGATQKLRQSGFTKPIIALTAHAMEGDREACLAAGCDEYLTKPIDSDALLKMIRSFVPEHASD